MKKLKKGAKSITQYDFIKESNRKEHNQNQRNFYAIYQTGNHFFIWLKGEAKL